MGCQAWWATGLCFAEGTLGHYEGVDWSPWVESAEEKKVEGKERVSGSFGREKIGRKQRYLNGI